ncbi:hypothetical protein DUNSADRAFT_7071 [Dunaliella salina]|uniref:Uncharacterized protein n=1 Tax=Dunaliella salina TaxID=3046 RepID=A0ABQ7H6J0_DUNSA|nr:hypothetical protein DUNSADRAFT_7071 [Dunaliella salina]|eukprot:KAF5842462.1 hypothetical protein DUNSADRAFT_7071 [Dunaliella salina]
MDKNYRHRTTGTCIHAPETQALDKYILTLLAQRREVQLSDIHELLRDGNEAQTNDASLVQKLTLQAVSSKALDLERHLLQKELTLTLESSFGCARNGVDAMHWDILRTGTPLAGMPEALGLLWFCKSRQASLAVEQQELQHHIAAVHAAHLHHALHSASRSAPGVATHPVPHYQFDHAGPLQANGICACEKELAAAEQCMEAVLHAQADMAARVARLAEGFDSRTATGAQSAILESDWQVALLHAAWVALGGRFAKRLAARIAILPQSHNHRFPALEQVAGEDLARDRRMASLNLRHPPRVVRHASVAAGLADGFIECMDLHARLSSAAKEAAANDGTLPTEVFGGVWGSSDACVHHRHLYVARRALPVLLGCQDQLWPEMPLEFSDQSTEQHQQQQQQQKHDEQARCVIWKGF